MQEVKEIIRALRCSSGTRPAGHVCDGCPYLVHEAITEEENPEAYRHLRGLGAQTEWDSCDCDTIAHEAADALEEYARGVGRMTTTELIEKYGIGPNCLSDAYALGMTHGLDGMEEAARLAEVKARADAIDEYFSKAEDMLYSDLYEYDEMSMNDVIMVLGSLAEQLKEKKV